MIRIAAAAAFSAVLAVPAAAQSPQADPRLEPAFSGTIISTYPDGRVGKLWLNRDGTYRGQGRRGGASSGRWRISGEQICFRQSRPVWSPFSHCTRLPDAEPGQSWTDRAVTGETIRVRVTPGR